MKHIGLSILFACVAISAYSDGRVVSPVINSDNTVTFTVVAPGADEVQIKGTCTPRKKAVDMKQEGDVWTYTTTSLPSELYTYQLFIDDNEVVDPANTNVFRDVADSLNYFVISGGIGDDYMRHDVAHGTVEKVWYPSEIEGMSKRRMTIYLPAAYNTDKTRKFPVLYLLHGSGGDENSWSDAGRAINILDNLIADGRCKPMIVVMPNGNASLAAAPGEDPANPDARPKSNNTSSMLGTIESAFMHDVVEYVDNHYRTRADKQHRAIAGLSLGGLHTMFISMNNPTSFDYVGLFSAQTTNALDGKSIGGMQKVGGLWGSIKENVPFLSGTGIDRAISKITSDNLSIYDNVDLKLRKQFADDPALYYIACGEDDFVKTLNDDLRKKLDAYEYPYVYKETDGAHTWENWRKYLVDFLPRLFKSK